MCSFTEKGVTIKYILPQIIYIIHWYGFNLSQACFSQLSCTTQLVNMKQRWKESPNLASVLKEPLAACYCWECKITLLQTKVQDQFKVLLSVDDKPHSIKALWPRAEIDFTFSFRLRKGRWGPTGILFAKKVYIKWSDGMLMKALEDPFRWLLEDLMFRLRMLRRSALRSGLKAFTTARTWHKIKHLEPCKASNKGLLLNKDLQFLPKLDLQIHNSSYLGPWRPQLVLRDTSGDRISGLSKGLKDWETWWWHSNWCFKT